MAENQNSLSQITIEYVNHNRILMTEWTTENEQQCDSSKILPFMSVAGWVLSLADLWRCRQELQTKVIHIIHSTDHLQNWMNCFLLSLRFRIENFQSLGISIFFLLRPTTLFFVESKYLGCFNMFKNKSKYGYHQYMCNFEQILSRQALNTSIRKI